MRTFIVGDFRTGTGPANVTKEYIRCFPKGTLYQKMTGKLQRVPELFIKVMLSDVVLFSGYSAQNVFGMKFAKFFNKPTAYLVHGAIDYENKINDNENAHMSEIEAETFKRADLLLGVSEKFSNWLKLQYPQYVNKIDHVTNGVDFDYLESLSENNKNSVINGEINRSNYKILSIGGGMPRKMILHVCAAIEKINSAKSDNKYELYVIGNEGKDTDAIKSYSFVHYLGLVDSSKKEELFRSCGLFIQNSCFETFGLAVFEALMSGCNILTSEVAGALDLLPNAISDDIIYKYDDIDEISSKILKFENISNCERLKNQINKDSASWEARTKEMEEKLKGLLNGKA